MVSIFLEKHKSTNEGVVPLQWLQACITAIHKKGAKNLFDNYRAVSITSIICKLMESILKDKIINHLERNNLFSRKQHVQPLNMHGKVD